MTEGPSQRFTDLPRRPSRRSTDGGPQDSPQARRRRLVRFIAADPDLLAWLADSKARTLHRVAADLATDGYVAAAEHVRAYADLLLSGEVGPFT